MTKKIRMPIIIHRLYALKIILPTMFLTATIKEKYPDIINNYTVSRKVQHGLLAAIALAVLYGCGNKDDSAKSEL
ncbi:MAG: hypothetical protein ACXW0T_11500, partial [Methylobacter sp.]